MILDPCYVCGRAHLTASGTELVVVMRRFKQELLSRPPQSYTDADVEAITQLFAQLAAAASRLREIHGESPFQLESGGEVLTEVLDGVPVPGIGWLELTEAEREVLPGFLTGLTHEEISREVDMDVERVEPHVDVIVHKIRACSS